MKNHFLIAGATCIVCAGLGFYGGTTYASLSKTDAGQKSGRGQYQGGAGQGRQGGFGQGRGGLGGFVNGEVLSKDDKSITIKLRDGGSKIIFVTDKTKTLKSVEGSLGDVLVGAQVMVSGDANPDGSLTGLMLQLRPAMPTSAQATSEQKTN